MCGRHTLTKKEKLAELFREGFVFDEFSEIRIRPRFNISPTQVCPIILDSSPQTVSVAKWGLVPSWAKDEKGRGEHDQRARGDWGEQARLPHRVPQAAVPRAGGRVLRVAENRDCESPASLRGRG